MDASPYRWFLNGMECSLHGVIDDAGGEVLHLVFASQECLEGYFELTKGFISQYGIPLAVYVDRHTIFRSPLEGKLSLEEELSGKRAKVTQFGREPRDPQSAFRPLEENVNLDFILCRKETRKVDNGSTFSFSGVKYRAIDQGKVVALVPHSPILPP